MKKYVWIENKKGASSQRILYEVTTEHGKPVNIQKVKGFPVVPHIENKVNAIISITPKDASVDNKLTDEEFVNRKVDTYSASFRGLYNLVGDLGLNATSTQNQISTALNSTIPIADNNDFCHVGIPISDTIPNRIQRTDRYKFNGTAWSYEFTWGNADLVPYRAFHASWHTDTTLLQFCQDVVGDSEVIVGDLFLGSLTCSGLPAGMVNGEVSVQVQNGLNNQKLLVLTLTSTNLAPYHWEMCYINGNLYGWRSFDLEGTAQSLLAAAIDTMQMSDANGDISIQYDDGQDDNNNDE